MVGTYVQEVCWIVLQIFITIIIVFPFLVLQCCEALAAAVHSCNESSTCIVPRILFLDGYFNCEDKSNWNWPSGVKMNVMGSLILQEVFRFQNVCDLSYSLILKL